MPTTLEPQKGSHIIHQPLIKRAHINWTTSCLQLDWPLLIHLNWWAKNFGFNKHYGNKETKKKIAISQANVFISASDQESGELVAKHPQLSSPSPATKIRPGSWVVVRECPGQTVARMPDVPRRREYGLAFSFTFSHLVVYKLCFPDFSQALKKGSLHTKDVLITTSWNYMRKKNAIQIRSTFILVLSFAYGLQVALGIFYACNVTYRFVKYNKM